jgi:hypothetical protein
MEVIVVGLEPGEMLLESVREAVRRHDIQNGVVVSGIGTLKSCHLHHIEHTDFPPKNRFFKIEKPLELSSVSGVIADGEPHLHVVVSYRDEEVYTGHLEEGSEVLYLAELVILKFNELRMTRHPDVERRIRLLGPKE